MRGNLRKAMKKHLDETDVPLTTISEKADVPYGALDHFAKRGGKDMKSLHMERLYEYFTGTQLIEEDDS